MSFIEGIGDEVAAFGVLLLVLILAATVTFLLNSTPVSQRHFIRTSTNVSSAPSSYQNRQNHDQQQEPPPERGQRSNQTNGNIETVSSGPTPNSSTTQEEEENHTATETDVQSAKESNCKEKSSPESATPKSQIYPDVPAESESISGHVSEESEAENEDAPATDPSLSHIRLKYLNDTERSVTSLLTTTIGEFKRSHFAEDLANNKVVRLIYAGQRLQDHATLQSYGIADNCVIHVQVVEAQIPNTSQSSQNTDLDLSHLLWPLLSVILGICWILYFKYPDFFNLMSLGMLFLFTGSFVYFYSQVQHHS